MSKHICTMALIACLAAGQTHAATVVSAGTHTLRAEQAGQVIDILVAGGDAADGLNFYLTVDDGLSSAGLGPAITDLDLSGPGTIFAGKNVFSEISVPGTQSAWGGLAIAFGEVSATADGILVKATLDTTGVAADQHPLMLTDVRATELIDPEGLPIPTTLQPGLLIVPKRLVWQTATGQWQDASWNDGTGPVAPAGGEDMNVLSGRVDVDTTPAAAAWLEIAGGTVDVSAGSGLTVSESAYLSGDGALTIDGTLTAGELLATGGTLSGTGSITAGTVTIGGILSPGGPQAVPPPAGAALAAVPEPSALLLALSGLLLPAAIGLRRQTLRRSARETPHARR
jgi:hypothetical protein